MQQNNQVSLSGRVSVDPILRELPSGDSMVTFRVVVDRPPAKGTGHRQVDVIDVASWSKTSCRAALRLKPDDIVEVEGCLRRRFFKTPQGASSRYEVEASRIKRVRAAKAG